jgi:hypothetical protein
MIEQLIKKNKNLGLKKLKPRANYLHSKKENVYDSLGEQASRKQLSR